jgi:hypothetical protein
MILQVKLGLGLQRSKLTHSSKAVMRAEGPARPIFCQSAAVVDAPLPTEEAPAAPAFYVNLDLKYVR